MAKQNTKSELLNQKYANYLCERIRIRTSSDGPGVDLIDMCWLYSHLAKMMQSKLCKCERGPLGFSDILSS